MRADTTGVNPWVRVVLVFALAVAAALFLKLLPPVLVLVAFVGGGVAINMRLKGRVKRERATFRSEIVDIQVGLLSRRLADRSLTLELTGAARDLLATRGYEPAFGARPLKRLIQREVQDPLAMKLLAGEIREGDRVVVEAEGDTLAFRTTPAAAEHPATAAP